MKITPTVSIGIAAYNEEQNIIFLIKNLLKQKYDSTYLEKIIIVSDGSTDNTVSLVKSIKNEKICLLERKDRKGAMQRQNEIIQMANSDILVMLNGDVLPMNDNFIHEITMPILQDKKIGIVGADTKSIEGESFFEKVIAFSHEFKKSIYKSIRGGNNLYLCHGRARAFSRKLYKDFKWAKKSPEDAYSYLECISRGFKFSFSDKATVLFRSPSEFIDHSKQSIRFEEGKRNLQRIFSKKIIEKEYKIPKDIILRKLFIFFFKNPFYMLSYVVVKTYLLYFRKKGKINFSTWEIAYSSKKIINI